jgi:hypothetical protein
MSTDNVSPIRPEAAKPRRARRKRAPPPANTFDMPPDLLLVCALQAVCAAMDNIDSLQELETQHGLATAAAILSKMVRESLTNTGVI